MGIKCSGNKKKNKNNNENEIKINLKKDEKNTNNVLKDGKQCDSNTSPDTPKKDTNEIMIKKKKVKLLLMIYQKMKLKRHM